MQYKIIQRNNELWSAEFDIINDKDQVVGNISFNGNMGSVNGVFDIKYMNDHMSMIPTTIETAKEMAGRYVDFSSSGKIIKPYTIDYNGNSGIIFSHLTKTKSYLNIGNDPLNMYVIGFGKKGLCNPIYRGETCVGEIHKEVTVYDDLHEFSLCFPDYNIVPAQILLTCHSYVMHYYKPGKKITKGMSKNIYTTKDKELILKCKNSYYLND
ncbi:hypothetical protein SAMN06297422_12073 [Lachnospiraceae bacterium]|nr:hypothetical protein SAMN06297422_12073 [Lachnospiraceae bacterium]